MNLGETIRSLRNTNDMTQKELADKLSISPSTIGMYEQNRREPDLDTLSKIANVFNVTIDYLVETEKSNETDLPNMIGKQLKLLRETKHKNQQEVCCALNIEQSTLVNYENDKRIPKVDILIKLANYYNVSVDYLLGLKNTAFYENQKITDTEKKLLNTFIKLNEDNQDIIIGEAKKLLKEQYYEESVAAEESLKRTGTDDLGK